MHPKVYLWILLRFNRNNTSVPRLTSACDGLRTQKQFQSVLGCQKQNDIFLCAILRSCPHSKARLSKPRSKPILTDMCAFPSSRDPHPSTHANDATEKTRCLTSLPLAKSPANAGNPLGVIRIAILCSEKIPPQCTRRFIFGCSLLSTATT